MRPSRDENLMEHARLEGERGTCSRNKVGVVFAREGRILISGYNGAPRGVEHCSHECDCGKSEGLKLLHDPHDSDCLVLKPCSVSVHAEANAIAFAARHGVRLDGSDMHCTVTPCLSCAQLVINAGVVRASFDREYRDRSGLILLEQAGIIIS